MKKITCLSFILLLSIDVSSQKRWNITTGFTLSSFSKDLIYNFGFNEFRSNYIAEGGSATSPAINSIKAGGMGSAELDIFLNEETFLRLGLRYLTLGDAFYFKTDDIQQTNGYGSQSNAKYILRPRIDYLGVPTLIGIKFSDRVSFYAGLYSAFALNNIIRFNDYLGNLDDLDQEWYSLNSPYKSRTFIIFGQVGASFYLNDGITSLDVRVSRSFLSPFSDPFVNPSFASVNAAALWSLELGMGVYFLRESE